MAPDTSVVPDAATVQTLLDAALQAIAATNDSATLAAAKYQHTGDKSPLAMANGAIGNLPPDERRAAGQLIGQARSQIAAAFTERATQITAVELAAKLHAETVDVTLPTPGHRPGALHPITQMLERMADIFVAMGWEVAEGPELEAEWLNFDALNFTPYHPARFMSDTLFIDPLSSHKLLRTHTSPVQIRALLERELPVYVVSPGKVFRADEYDATHLPVFHQLEGLAVDKGITMAHLRGTLDQLAQALFGADIRTRMRPHYFPFTEPSGEVDLLCFVCHGESVGNPEHPCRTCRSEGWIEWGGCGIVNPKVLAACGIDTEQYSGFAFGMGVDRTVMFKAGAGDLREFVEGDVRFDAQFAGGVL
ncbi:MAG: phenylalanine--tRNA ligase subunit alpha [Propionibacteriaceae bacterium]|nr:phenylalanine--tRNA ligase subunit alpha [Propionibacteriaceae bacterium]